MAKEERSEELKEREGSFKELAEVLLQLLESQVENLPEGGGHLYQCIRGGDSSGRRES